MAWAAEAGRPKPRLAFAFFRFGVPMPPEDHPLRRKYSWFPTGEGASFEYTEVPLSNLFITMLDRLGTGIESFKDSDGSLSELIKASHGEGSSLCTSTPCQKRD